MSSFVPLADRLRPTTIDDIVGQDHLLGNKGPVRRMIEQGRLSSMIFWGPPGCGKTTLARLLSQAAGYYFETLSATSSGVVELRKLFDAAVKRKAEGQTTLLFLDEIHRYAKNQQDVLLPYVEDGTVVLVGATTENPSFALNGAILSRAKVYVLKPLGKSSLEKILIKAELLQGRELALSPEARRSLLDLADGDGRYLLNMIDDLFGYQGALLDPAGLGEIVQKRMPLYDKGEDHHYNGLSAFHKSCRASDVDAALYWASRIIQGGEDPKSLFRRLQCVASEDIGMADPDALVQVLSAWQAFERLGWPEGRLPLAQAICYVATAPKSNAAYMAFNAAYALAAETGSLDSPNFARNAPTKIMKDLGYKEGYIYDHDTEEGVSGLDYLPEPLRGKVFYRPVARGFERDVGKRLDHFKRIRAKRLDRDD